MNHALAVPVFEGTLLHLINKVVGARTIFYVFNRLRYGWQNRTVSQNKDSSISHFLLHNHVMAIYRDERDRAVIVL